ncbi:hypothetical protein SOVF_092030 [Spinacia oleracea]|nr:hypothetical protein SOVF_092030 [Spinacia oleracea]
MGDKIPSQYVKLTREQEAVEITPGELNQPVRVPQLHVKLCPECGQQLPVGFEIPADEPWMSGICGCAQDPEICMTGLLCPCVLFGRNVERFKEEIPWTNACVCHAVCIEGGITIAALISIFNGYIDPNTIRLVGEALLFAWWICGIYNGLFREDLQKKYHLQEHREMKGRLSENTTMTPMTVVNPPPVQEMTSDHTHDSSSSSENGSQHHRHTDLQIQPL